MKDPHLIYQTIFDIHFSSPEKNHAMQDKISDLFNRRINNEINDLFSEYAHTDQTIRINELTIDTGRLQYGELEQELPLRIIEALRKELDKLNIRQDTTPEPAPAFKVISASERALQTTDFFLETGIFSGKNVPYDIADLLSKLIQNNKARLIQLLKRKGKKEYVRKRLVYRLKEERLNRLIHLLEPSYGKLIIDYINDSEVINENKPILPTGRKEFRQANYLFVLTYLFTERGSVFNTRNFVRSQIRQMAAHYNIAYNLLLLRFVQALPEQFKTRESNNLFYFIRQVFFEDTLTDSPENLPVFENATIAKELPEAILQESKDQYLYQYLEKGYAAATLRSLTPKQLAAMLSDALKNRPTRLLHFLRRSSRKYLAVNIIKILAETEDKKLIRHLQPQSAERISELSALLMKIQLHDLFSPPLHPDTMQKIVRETILQTVLSTSSDPFNRKTFLLKVVDAIGRTSAARRHFRMLVKERLELARENEYSNFIEEKTIGQKEAEPEEEFPYQDDQPNEPKSTSKEMNALKYFLLHGTSPWWYSPTGSSEYSILLEKHFYNSSGTQMLSFIRKHITESKFRENLLALSGNTIWIPKKLRYKQEESKTTESLLPGNKLSYTTYKAIKEAYLLFALLRSHRKQELLWNDIQNIFASYRISLRELYEELLPLKNVVRGLPSESFFSFLQVRFMEALIFSDKEHKPSSENKQELQEIGTLPENKQATGQRSIQDLLDYLHTGTVNNKAIQDPKELILRNTKNTGTQKDSDDAKLLFLTLKNETSVNRLLSPLNKQGQEKIIQQLFPQQYGLLKDYLDDLHTIFNSDAIKRKFSVPYALLVKLTLFFLSENHRKNFRIADYLKFMMKRLFPVHSNYTAFLGLVKINALYKKLRLKTWLVEELRHTEREEKKKESGQQEDKEEKDERIFIENAGLILLSPFFSFYFQTLGLTENNAFISEQAAARAACLLEYLVTGNENISEQTLSLNKVLCNISRHSPIEDFDGLTEKEKELSDQLLNTVIARWEILKNTSTEGLRNSFLKRNGKLEWTDEKISLEVESKGYDMLLDKIPWNIAVIKLPWMEKTIYVKWR